MSQRGAQRPRFPGGNAYRSIEARGAFLLAVSLCCLFAARASAQPAPSTSPVEAVLVAPDCEARWLSRTQLLRQLDIELSERGAVELRTSDASLTPDEEAKTLHLVVELASCDEPTQAILQLRLGGRELAQIVDVADVEPGNHARAIAMLFGGMLARFLPAAPPGDPPQKPAPPDEHTALSPAPAPESPSQASSAVPSRFALSVGPTLLHSFSGPNWLWGGFLGLDMDLTNDLALQSRAELLTTRVSTAIGDIDVVGGLLGVAIAWVPLKHPLQLELSLGPWIASIWGRGRGDATSVGRSAWSLALAAALRARVGYAIGSWQLFIESGPDLMLYGAEFTADSSPVFALRDALVQMFIGIRWRPPVPSKK